MVIHQLACAGNGTPVAPIEGAGEGVRLKLQTPLFVADALVGAAGQRVSAELSAAKVRGRTPGRRRMLLCPLFLSHVSASGAGEAAGKAGGTCRAERVGCNGVWLACAGMLACLRVLCWPLMAPKRSNDSSSDRGSYAWKCSNLCPTCRRTLNPCAS